MRERIIKATTDLYTNNVKIREIPDVEEVQNVQLVEGFHQKFLPAPGETQGDEGQDQGKTAKRSKKRTTKRNRKDQD